MARKLLKTYILIFSCFITSCSLVNNQVTDQPVSSETPPVPPATLTETPEPTAILPPTITSTPTITPTVILDPSPLEIEFFAEDGQVLSGVYFPADSNPAPLMILMHWARGDQEEWTEVAVGRPDTATWAGSVACTSCIPDSLDEVLEVFVRGYDGTPTADGRGHVNGPDASVPILSFDVIFDVAPPEHVSSVVSGGDDSFEPGEIITVTSMWDGYADGLWRKRISPALLQTISRWRWKLTSGEGQRKH